MTEQKISRRKFLALAGATSGAALLAGSGVKVADAKAVQGAGAGKAARLAADAKKVNVWLNVYQPTEWTVRSAEHPLVVNATRTLAKKFQEQNPNIEIAFPTIDIQYSGTAEKYAAYLTARIASGDAPDMVWSSHNIPVQNNWTQPIEQYLDQPNPYATKYAKWRDLFYPNLMKSLVWEDKHEYCAPIRAIWPYLEVGLAYNKETFAKMGLKPPATWSDEMNVAKELKKAGSGLSPWPQEGQSGNCWPLALQILPPMMQKICADMDLNKDKFVNAEEALPAYRKGLIGPNTPIYRRAWKEMHDLASNWVSGFDTTDLNQLYRKGDLALQYRATWEFATLANDPTIRFEQGFLPSPIPNSKDIPAVGDQPGAYDSPRTTPGDGTVPADLITAIQGPDWVILRDSVQKHGTLDETIKWWQFCTTPENNGFIVNENQQFIPSAVDAPLGSLWKEIANYKLPVFDYTIAWWGMGLYWDATHFANWRKLFVGWMTGQMDEKTFFDRQEQESKEGADRYEATLRSKPKS